MKTICLALYSLLVMLSFNLCAGTPDLPLFNWPAVSGESRFLQLKTIQGLPVPLQSEGTITVESDGLVWHTVKPVEQQLLISSEGVSQWQQQQYTAIAGSQFIGQLMLAVMQRNAAFLQQHFTFQSVPPHCTTLTPIQPPLSQLFASVDLCGQHQLSQITLTELNGNVTQITLLPKAAN